MTRIDGTASAVCVFEDDTFSIALDRVAGAECAAVLQESPLEKLVRQAPDPLNLAEIRRRMRREGCPRSLQMISNFLHGRIIDPSEEFLGAFAAAIGRSVRTVSEAHRKTRRWAETR